jgi:hypothetical protein
MKKENCNTCGSPFGDLGDGPGTVPRQSLKNRSFLATLNEAGEVIRECCEFCALEVLEKEE